jgi:uncharacterized SAM-binding protein YcdF (DUF218 family)
MFDEVVTKYAKVIWEYHHMHQDLKKADVLLVLGSHDLRVPEYAAKLFKEGLAPIVIISGGTAHNDDLLSTGWNMTEAEKFSQIMQSLGVPHDKIVLETSAKNTGDNFELSKKLAEEKMIVVHSILAVTKPYMERRAFASGQVRWPGAEIIVTSPPGSFEEYFAGYVNQDISPENILNIMIGDLQRIDIYGKNGFQSLQAIPEEVWEAYRALTQKGFTKHLII